VALLYGWSRETWSSGPWSQPAPLAVTGVEAAGALGSESIKIDVTIEVTGLEIANSIGTVTVVTNAILTVTGVAAAGALGSESVITELIFGVTGVEAVGEIGDIGKGVSFVVTGVEAQGLVTTPNVWSVIDTTQDANWVQIAA
jgi:hypothetical protein